MCIYVCVCVVSLEGRVGYEWVRHSAKSSEIGETVAGVLVAAIRGLVDMNDTYLLLKEL